MHKFFQTIFSFIFNFYKFIWFKFLKLSKAGKILAVSFLVFVFAISSLVANSSQNNSQVLGKVGQNQSKISSQNSNSVENLANNKKNFVSSTEKSSEMVKVENSKNTDNEIIKQSSQNTQIFQKTASASANSEISSQNQNQNLEKTTDLSDKPIFAQNLDKKLYQVLEVVDGDTIKISEIGTLRLIGLDTPETKDPRKVVQCFGKEASTRATELLANKKVYLEFDKSKPILDKYQRTLAYVFREDGYFYNLEMVKDGFAHSYKSFPHPKIEEFNSAENSARNAKIGFWADNTCGGNTEQPAGGEIAKATVPPTGGTQEKPKETVQVPKTEVQVEKDTEKLIAGSCKSLNEKGLGNFRPGSPNYTKARDRNNDGVACEM